MSEYQSYLKDCDCKGNGVIFKNLIPICRWCRKPYGTGGQIFYEDEHFKSKEVTVYPEGILSFKNEKDGIIYTKSDYLKYQTWCQFCLGQQFEKNIIFQVNNSSQEVLTIGQDTNAGKILKLFLSADNSYILAETNKEEYGIIHTHIDNVHPIQPKVFVTEDGYQIKEHDSVILVYPNLEIASDSFSPHLNYSKTKLFKIPDAAEEYIRMNRKEYSRQDILNAKAEFVTPTREMIWIDKSKLNL